MLVPRANSGYDNRAQGIQPHYMPTGSALDSTTAWPYAPFHFLHLDMVILYTLFPCMSIGM